MVDLFEDPLLALLRGLRLALAASAAQALVQSFLVLLRLAPHTLTVFQQLVAPFLALLLDPGFLFRGELPGFFSFVHGCGAADAMPLVDPLRLDYLLTPRALAFIDQPTPIARVARVVALPDLGVSHAELAVFPALQTAWSAVSQPNPVVTDRPKTASAFTFSLQACQPRLFGCSLPINGAWYAHP
jgi:hypothetical protein